VTEKERAEAAKRNALELADWAHEAYYTRIARAIEELLKCHIRIYPAKEPPILSSWEAFTYSRPVQCSVYWPEEREFRAWDHFIFFDANLDARMAAFVIAHELAHIAYHLGKDPSVREKDIDPATEQVRYKPEEEWEADAFALFMLRYRKAVRDPNETWLSETALMELVEEYVKRVGEEHQGLGGQPDSVRALIEEGLFADAREETGGSKESPA